MVDDNNVFEHFDDMSKDDLVQIVNESKYELQNMKFLMEEENNKREKYKIENERRQHNYIPFIFELLKTMAEKNVLENIYDEAKKELENKNKK